MTPAEAVALARSVVDDIERDMLASEDAGELERLRREREHALRVVAQAEQRESAERERLRNLPLTPAALEGCGAPNGQGRCSSVCARQGEAHEPTRDQA